MVAFVLGITLARCATGQAATNNIADEPDLLRATLPNGLQVILSNLKDMQTKKVTSRELHQAKLMMLRDIPLAESSVDYLARGWLSRSMLGLPLDEPVRAARIYVKLDAKDVQSAFAKWLRSDDLVQVTQGPVPK